MKEWHFFDKVYRRWVVLFIGDHKELAAELKANGYTDDTEWFAEALGACVELNATNNDQNQNATVVWLKEYNTATLVHEIAHLVMMLFDQVGVPISRDNTEAFSFYSEYWYNEINRARRKHPNGNRPKDVKK